MTVRPGSMAVALLMAVAAGAEIAMPTRMAMPRREGREPMPAKGGRSADDIADRHAKQAAKLARRARRALTTPADAGGRVK